MNERLDKTLEDKFSGVSNEELIRSIEQSAEFGADDEEYELSRRLRGTGYDWRYKTVSGREFIEIYEIPTDESLIDGEIARAAEAEEQVSDAGARVIASQLHGGQGSALYALSSTGFIDEDQLAGELHRNRREFKDDPRVLGWIEQLERYVMHRESTDAVEGWSRLWLGGER